MSEQRTVSIPARFRGPPTSANGGYACGVLGAFIGGAAEVTLRKPPPLETELALVRDDEGRARLCQGEILIAEAIAAEPALDPPKAVPLDEAEHATTNYPGRVGHIFPTCFVCGPDRDPDDGLCIFPGPIAERQVAAAPWRPHASLCDDGGTVRTEVMWAALDCPSYFGHYAFRAMETAVLGRLTGKILRSARAGEPLVALGWDLGADGRKLHAGSAIMTPDGEVLAVARATWIKV